MCDTSYDSLVPLAGKNCDTKCDKTYGGGFGVGWAILIIIIIFIIVIAALWVGKPCWLQSAGPDGTSFTNIWLLLLWAIAIVVIILIIIALIWAVFRMFTG